MNRLIIGFFIVILLILQACTTNNNLYYNSMQTDTPSLEEIQTCVIDDDCTNADNSCCPYTSWDNIVAINKEYKEDYKEIGEACPEVVLCSEIVMGRQADTKCINNQCIIVK